jgi:very-short-patch-repair endonuclease
MVFICKTIERVQYFGAPAATIEFAKRLRKRVTPAEKIIWKRLKGKNIKGVKFRRQQPIGRYVADFYCHQIRLVIEIDGLYHLRKKRTEHDKTRTDWMKRYDIKVIRFTNDEVKYHIARVIKTIREEILKRLQKVK